jgi:hypothetical protein
MIATYLRRGLVAGLLAGILAGLLGLLVGEPALDSAVAIEETRASRDPADAGALTVVTRPQQKAGLVVGSALVGLAVGGLFAIAGAWAVGRLQGDGWLRSLKLGAVLVAAWVVLPALKYPPGPPGAGDPDTIATRTMLYLGLAFIGLLLAGGAYAGALQLRATPLPAPARQAVVGIGTLMVAAAVLAVLPAAEAAPLPGELLWSFRIGSLATQIMLYGGTAVLFGLLSARDDAMARVSDGSA